MHSDSHFYPATTPQSSQVTIWVNQHPLTVPASWSIAAALLANGHLITRRSMLDDKPRGPYCMMGVCFECRLTVNGVRNVQACMTPVQEGMQIITPSTAESA